MTRNDQSVNKLNSKNQRAHQFSSKLNHNRKSASKRYITIIWWFRLRSHFQPTKIFSRHKIVVKILYIKSQSAQIGQIRTFSGFGKLGPSSGSARLLEILICEERHHVSTNLKTLQIEQKLKIGNEFDRFSKILFL